MVVLWGKSKHILVLYLEYRVFKKEVAKKGISDKNQQYLSSTMLSWVKAPVATSAQIATRFIIKLIIKNSCKFYSVEYFFYETI